MVLIFTPMFFCMFVMYCAKKKKKWPSDRSKRILFGGWLPGLKGNPFFFLHGGQVYASGNGVWYLVHVLEKCQIVLGEKHKCLDRILFLR